MELLIENIFYLGPMIALVMFALSVLLWPVKTNSLRPYFKISLDYGESVGRINQLHLNDSAEVSDFCHAIFLTHGRKMPKVVVMYHGYTNCPRQYEKLAKQFFEKGYNVYVPRVPHNGLKDLVTKEIGKLMLEEIVQVCDESVDIAQGLGDEVTVLGISMGGVMAAWNAQFRDDVDIVVSIAPSFGWYFLPGMIKPLINLSYVLPNMFLWWDPVKKDDRDAPYSMYHKFATRPMGHIMRLGLSVFRSAKNLAPKVKKIYVMTYEDDIAVDEANTQRLIHYWRKNGADVSDYQFSKDLKMEHDIIDPLHPYDQTDIVYQKIFELLDE